MHAGHLAATRAGQTDVPAWPGAVAGEAGEAGEILQAGTRQTACGNVNTRSGS
jgi:hypothetical protein